MPLYEYQCDACGERTEVLQKFSDEPKIDCPDCQEPKLKRLISSTHFQLKGTGWYATDFKDQGKAPKTEKKTASSKNTKEKKPVKSSDSSESEP